MYKDKVKQKEANREWARRHRAGTTGTTPGTTDSVTPRLEDIPTIRPLGLPLSLTGSKCNSFESLPQDVQDSIDSLGRWCKLSHIEDDRDARIDRAIHYQQYVRAG